MSGKDEENIKNIVLLAKSGDEEAFGQIYEMYFTPIFRYIFLRTKDKFVAENLSQEVFLKSFQAISKFEEKGRPFLAYLFTAARNKVIDHWKKPKDILIEEEKSLENLSVEDNLIESVEKKEESEKILEIIDNLTEEKKEVVILKFFGDLKGKEIAEIMNKSEEAVRQIQSRALKDLKKILGENVF